MSKRVNKLVSYVMVMFAMIMFFAHLIIPHSHSICTSTTHCIELCSGECEHHHHSHSCQSGISEPSEQHNHSHQCIITNDIYQTGSEKESNTKLLIVAVEHFGFIIPKIILDSVDNYYVDNYCANIYELHLTGDSPLRAPPIA